MSPIQLLPIGAADPFLLASLGKALSAEFATRYEILPTELSPEPSLSLERQQYFSTGILERMLEFAIPESGRLLGVASVDLYIPILTFVFGEAQLDGPRAVVSTHRLNQEFYGLPADRVLLRERLIKESVHEIGHTLGLTHCDDYQCAMAPSHTVEWIDLKSTSLCLDCRARSFPTLTEKRS